MTAHVLAGALADDGRRRIFAAIVLGATSATEVAERTGLPARVVLTGVRRLTDAGLVTGADGALATDEASLRATARDGGPADDAESGVDPVLRTFLRAGVLVSLPAQRGRRRVLLAHIAEQSFEPGTRYPERAVDDALKPWCAAGGSDHATLRRYLIDEQLLTREHGIYQRL
ncbi:hypothetical protein ONO23_03272 [Micromonospora noduli]|uniref:DUF2087 domain-containing protein n=1 Tax=Micromonospora noduli TaxID=709876 RepID=A0A328MV96_9ACTN|nr:DUF2087 domain-containing protein [Micromonospora noduli]RAN96115.1 hypothetical protein LAH08_04857 [Micromonospora noduli]RAO32375.1 hypothetical protein ONO23_03272 [Micromonospora noduli]